MSGIARRIVSRWRRDRRRDWFRPSPAATVAAGWSHEDEQTDASESSSENSADEDDDADEEDDPEAAHQQTEDASDEADEVEPAVAAAKVRSSVSLASIRLWLLLGG